jgi:hypothetical protein
MNLTIPLLFQKIGISVRMGGGSVPARRGKMMWPRASSREDSQGKPLNMDFRLFLHT